MNMKMVLSLCTLILIQCFFLTAFSQSLQVTGRVTNKLTNEPLSGATVSIKGGGGTVVTGTDGNFSITAPKSGSIMVITYTGMTALERAITKSGVLNFELEPADSRLDEVVVVGYGAQRKTSLTASVSTVKGSDIVRQPVADLSSALGGRAAGVLFTQTSGQPGNDAATINIRGIGTNGNSSPLFIVDGIPRNYSQLNPADVESITVLKDAAAVAPYGMGGANGVILVTTKKGKTGKPVLTYDGYVGFQNPTILTKFVNSYQFASMKNAGALNQGATTLPFSESDLQKYKDGSDPDGHSNTDAFGGIFQKNTLLSGHNLTLSGGTDIIKYAMGLGYLYQDGILPGINYKRYNLSGNMQIQATKSTTVSLSLNGRSEDRRLTTAGYNQQSLFEGISYQTAVSFPYVYSNGLHSWLYAGLYDNPSFKTITGNTMLTQFSIDQKLPLKGLSVKFVGSYDWNPFDPYSQNYGIEGFTRTWDAPNSYSYYNLDTVPRPYNYDKFTSTTLPTYTEEYHQTQAFTYQGYVNYAGNFGRSAVTGLLVLESRNTKSTKFSTGRRNYNLPVPEIFAGGSAASDQFNDGNSLGTKQRSLVYRVTYGFDNKYLFEAAGRYDGNYYFAPGHRFGFFPAFSAAWRLSEEEFLKNVKWISELKLKGSYGESGQLAGKAFQYQSGFNLYGTSAVLNNTLTQGLTENTEPNPNITWEKAIKKDIGLEATILNGKIHIEADYFHEKRNNMLLAPNVTVPVEYGVGISQVNAGSMLNRGFEFSIDGHHDLSKDLRVSLNANFSYAKNKLLQVYEDPSTYDYPNLRKTGRPLNTEFGYQALGLFQVSDFDANGNLKPGIATQTWSAVAPGEIRYADISGPDGKPDGVIDYRDQIAMGYPRYPAIIYAFAPSISYKGFELSLLFQGAAKRQIQLAGDAVLAFNNNKNAPITTLDYWTPDNPNATNPKILPTPSSNTSQASTFWERSAAYLRLRTGLLSYTLPAVAAKAIGANSVKFYFSGQNLLTWTPLKNFDPEISSVSNNITDPNGLSSNTNRSWYFPTQKAVTVGLNIQF